MRLPTEAEWEYAARGGTTGARYGNAQLSPSIAAWLRDSFCIDAQAVRDIGLRDAEDFEIYKRAKDAGAVIMTKDSDFVELQNRLDSPPQILWLTCGNTSNIRLREVLASSFASALEFL